MVLDGEINILDRVGDRNVSKSPLMEIGIERERNMAVSNIKKETLEETEGLRKELMTKQFYGSLNFDLATDSIPTNGNSIIKMLQNKYKDDNSLDGSLLRNPQVQNLLANIVSQYADEWNTVKDRYSKGKEKNEKAKEEVEKNELEENLGKNKGENSGENVEEKFEEVVDKKAESREEYALRESTYEKFQEWLISEDGIRVLKLELNDHIDSDGKIIENYCIDKKDLKLKLEKAWLVSLRRNYNLKNNIVDNSDRKKLNDIGVQIQNGINKAVKNHMINEGKEFDDKMVDLLKKLVGEDSEFFNELKDDSEKKDEFKVLLREYIKNYSNLVLIKDKGTGKIVDAKLETGSDQIDLQLRSYLFIYGKTFHPELFPKDSGNVAHSSGNKYDASLLDTLRVILYEDHPEIENMINDKGLLESEQREEEARRIRDYLRRQEAAKRNREINSRISSRINESNGKGQINRNTTNSNETTGRQLVKENNIDLGDFKGNADLHRFKESPQARQQAFLMAWEKLKQYDIIKDTITPAVIRSLFNITGNSEINSINGDAREEFCNNNVSMIGRGVGEKKEIHSILESFPSEYNNSLKLIASRIDKQEGKIDKEIKNSALGVVIDDIKTVFDNKAKDLEGNQNFKGFSLDKTEPVKRVGNNIIISGTFNGSSVKIRYDLDSGGLFMNSFIHHTHNPEKIVIGNNKPNLQIGQLKSFNEILEENYSAPDFSFDNSHIGNQINSGLNTGTNQGQNNYTNGEVTESKNNISLNHMLYFSKQKEQDKGQRKSIKDTYENIMNQDLDIIGGLVAENTNKQSSINSAVTNFMKTFNIIRDGQENNGIEFNGGGDLFDLLEIINNSDSNTLDKFQSFMNKITELSGLNWGSNNLSGPQDNLEPNILNEDNKNENISMLRNSRKDFYDKVKSPEDNKLSFESNYKFGFAQIVKKKLIADGTSKPNRKLDEKKMCDFFTDAGLNSPFQ